MKLPPPSPDFIMLTICTAWTIAYICLFLWLKEKYSDFEEYEHVAITSPNQEIVEEKVVEEEVTKKITKSSKHSSDSSKKPVKESTGPFITNEEHQDILKIVAKEEFTRDLFYPFSYPLEISGAGVPLTSQKSFLFIPHFKPDEGYERGVRQRNKFKSTYIDTSSSSDSSETTQLKSRVRKMGVLKSRFGKFGKSGSGKSRGNKLGDGDSGNENEKSFDGTNIDSTSVDKKGGNEPGDEKSGGEKDKSSGGKSGKKSRRQNTVLDKSSDYVKSSKAVTSEKFKKSGKCRKCRKSKKRKKGEFDTEDQDKDQFGDQQTQSRKDKSKIFDRKLVEDGDRYQSIEKARGRDRSRDGRQRDQDPDRSLGTDGSDDSDRAHSRDRTGKRDLNFDTDVLYSMDEDDERERNSFTRLESYVLKLQKSEQPTNNDRKSRSKTSTGSTKSAGDGEQKIFNHMTYEEAREKSPVGLERLLYVTKKDRSSYLGSLIKEREPAYHNPEPKVRIVTLNSVYWSGIEDEPSLNLKESSITRNST